MKLEASFTVRFCTRELNNGAITSTRSSLGYNGNIALKANGSHDKHSYFYNIFGSGASRIAYYRLSCTHLLYMICNSDKKGLLMILLKLHK